MVKAQQWINEMFPSQPGEKVKKLCICLIGGTNKFEQTDYEFSNTELEGELDLNEFKNLEDLTFWGNGVGQLQQITNLKINRCFKLQKLHIDCTNLSELNLSSNQEITSLRIDGCVNLLKIEGLEELSNLQNLNLWNKSVPNSKLQIPFNEDNWKQGIQELRRKKIHFLEEKANINEQKLKELADMVLPDTTFDLGKLKQEIARLKLNELSPQARKKTSELEQQINDAKNKVEGSFKEIIDWILKTQKQILGKNDSSAQAQLTGQLIAYLNILEKSLSKQELQMLLDKKTELIRLEKQIDRLQTEIQQNE
jgi:hypothetical protein